VNEAVKVPSQKSGAELVEPVETNGLRQAQASLPRNIEKICSGQKHVKQWFRTQIGGINRFLGFLCLICLIPRLCVLAHNVQNALNPYRILRRYQLNKKSAIW
jgi:hypothetical protein